MPGYYRQQLGVEGSEQTPDFAASLWTSDGGANEFEVQVDGDLLKVFAREVAPMIDIENVWNTAYTVAALAAYFHTHLISSVPSIFERFFCICSTNGSMPGEPSVPLLLPR